MFSTLETYLQSRRPTGLQMAPIREGGYCNWARTTRRTQRRGAAGEIRQLCRSSHNCVAPSLSLGAICREGEGERRRGGGHLFEAAQLAPLLAVVWHGAKIWLGWQGRGDERGKAKERTVMKRRGRSQFNSISAISGPFFGCIHI